MSVLIWVQTVGKGYKQTTNAAAIIALKASGHDCTNKNELVHKIGVLQCYAICNYSYLQVNVYKRFDGAVSNTVVLKESENKVEGLSPRLGVRVSVKPFFYYLFFAFAMKEETFRNPHVCRKKHVLMYYAQVKRLNSVKWRGLYGDTAKMQELLLKTCTSSAWRKRSLERNCH